MASTAWAAAAAVVGLAAAVVLVVVDVQGVLEALGVMATDPLPSAVAVPKMHAGGAEARTAAPTGAVVAVDLAGPATTAAEVAAAAAPAA